MDYTTRLSYACSKVLRSLREARAFEGSEKGSVVLNILRGGLNFGLREAMTSAFGWNRHAAAFISAQRARSGESPEDWYITENAYQKVYLPKNACIVFGDVVATGTSLQFALEQLLAIAGRQGGEITSILFLTIGGPRSEEILAHIDAQCRKLFKGFCGSTVVYFEGRFAVAEVDTPITVKFTGTDLLRTESILAPEFTESQFQDPAYPIERCTIYDAGSRAFWLPEYLEDVEDYWKQTLALAETGLSFETLLKERFPELEAKRFGSVDLKALCRRQIQRCDWE